MMRASVVRPLLIAMYVGGIVVTSVTRDGRDCQWIGVVITTAALGLYWVERPGFYRLVMAWCAGFILIVSGEALLDHDEIIRSVGRAAYDEASKYIVLAHLATLLGHSLVFSEARVRPLRRRWGVRPQTAIPLVVVSAGVCLLHFVPLAISTYTSGRVVQEAEVSSVGGAVLQGIATSMSVGVPILATWIAKRVRGPIRTVLLLIAGGIVLLQFLIAVRFLLLFTAVGSVIAWIAPHPPRGKRLLVAVGLALALTAASTILGQTRTFGLASSDVGRAADEVGFESFVLREGVVKTLALAVTYTRTRGFTDGRSTASVIVFWIPRSVWPDKPTLTGYWLPRAFQTSGFSTIFSAAQGFAGNAYLDFGMTGGVAFWFVVGLMFGMIERTCARILTTDGDVRVVLVAPLFGGSFFAVRSEDTTALVLLGVQVFLLLALALSLRNHRLSDH